MDRLIMVGVLAVAALAFAAGMFSNQLFGRFNPTIFSAARGVGALVFLGLVTYIARLRFG